MIISITIKKIMKIKMEEHERERESSSSDVANALLITKAIVIITKRLML